MVYYRLVRLKNLISSFYSKGLMMHDSLLKDILRSDQTVFSINELLLIWGKSNPALLRSRISYYLKKGYLYHLRRGLYAKSEEYNRLEVATKIFKPSYISFETVLKREGVLFQYYERIYVASYQTRTIECDGHTYVYRKLKAGLLTNSKGVDIKPYYSIATAERAFLDMVYLHKDYYFDNLSALEWEKVFEILPIYQNKRMEQQVDTYYMYYKKNS